MNCLLFSNTICVNFAILSPLFPLKVHLLCKLKLESVQFRLSKASLEKEVLQACGFVDD